MNGAEFGGSEIALAMYTLSMTDLFCECLY